LPNWRMRFTICVSYVTMDMECSCSSCKLWSLWGLILSIPTIFPFKTTSSILLLPRYVCNVPLPWESTSERICEACQSLDNYQVVCCVQQQSWVNWFLIVLRIFVPLISWGLVCVCMFLYQCCAD
jgi:hypothetical protein